MKDNSKKDINWPEAENRDLDPLLASLGHLAPREGFADAVLARVRVPSFEVALQPTRSVSRRWGWGLMAGYSVASAISGVFLVSLVAGGALQTGTFATATFAALRALQLVAAGLVSALPIFSSTPAFFNALPAIAGAAAAAWIITMVSAVGLHRIMSSYNIQRIPVNEIR